MAMAGNREVLSLSVEERHMAALLVERSCVDLKSLVTVEGECPLSNANVTYLLTDNSRARVWSGGSLSFAIWDARKKELVKVFGTNGQAEGRSDTEDEGKTKACSSSRKEKSHTSSFLQRSRNALMGAADAVRRVAGKGAFGDDNKRTEAVAVSSDGVIWTGYTNGSLVQWDGNGSKLQEIQHHSASVTALCAFASRLWVGYANGTVQVFDLEGTFDNALQAELACKEMMYTRFENIKILAGTWNVGQERASPDSLISWLGAAASEVGIVVVGLQEVEMGAGFLAVSAARESLASGFGSPFFIYCLAYQARKNLKQHIGDVDAAAVPCGLGRAIGNKGAVGLRIRIYDRIMCFVNCHFAAHLEAVNRRNADFNHVYRSMFFTRPLIGGCAAIASASNAQMHRWGNANENGRPELSEADMVVFLGDFNYRLYGITYDEARDLVSQRCFDWLREKDQLRAEMRSGKIFQGLREGQITFPPTYKFQRHQPGLSGYDSSEKKRIPAWCDRILYRDSRSISLCDCSLECPIVSSILQYEACMDVTDSDHKPVRCIFSSDIARLDEVIRRKLYGEITVSMRKSDDQSSGIRSKGSFGFPNWLKISPATGIIKPNATTELSIQHENLRTLEDFMVDGPQYQWTEDTLDSEVILILKVTGCRSTESRTHLIHVRRTFKPVFHLMNLTVTSKFPQILDKAFNAPILKVHMP
ncbi:hypothetical protein HPP92_019773 [Vanilla planifolia]|uniref:Inositol polyphosphate-related phosphatase domain-containing protein n=1 Tax=Vanilla planifolia TaxID=51239 RepID=A0A835UJM5_VANPL|nr:hypothetical protein HPP92_019773 [Vanilla planifolia]